MVLTRTQEGDITDRNISKIYKTTIQIARHSTQINQFYTNVYLIRVDPPVAY